MVYAVSIVTAVQSVPARRHGMARITYDEQTAAVAAARALAEPSRFVGAAGLDLQAGCQPRPHYHVDVASPPPGPKCRTVRGGWP